MFSRERILFKERVDDIVIQRPTNMKDIELKLVCELIKNSRKSDRELAKSIGVSQPTVSRIRAKLEKEGLIEYTGVPNLRKLGFEIIAIVFANWKRDRYSDTRVLKAQDFVKRHPNVIFVSTGQGCSADRVSVSVHKSYTDYAEYMREAKAEWGEFMNFTGTFLIALNSDSLVRPLSLRYLADYLAKEKP
jgi:DNA-binding Lrp family transcriptional regulator